MKNIGFIYSTDQRFEELIKANELSEHGEYLIRIHTCVHRYESIMDFANKILTYFPKAKIIGSSTSGVIYKGEILTDCCLVSITDFNCANIKSFEFSLVDEAGRDLEGVYIADKLTDRVLGSRSKFMIIMASRPFMKIDDFVERLNKNASEVQIIGGVANTNETPLLDMLEPESFVFNENGVYRNSIAGLVIDSEKLSVYSDVIYVTEPVGELHTITEADGNIIRSVGGVDAVVWYQELLGINFADFSGR